MDGYDSPVEDAGLLQDVAKVDVRVQEVGVQRHGLLEVVDGEPDLALGVEHAPQVAPGHGEVGPRLDGFQIARLHGVKGRGREEGRGGQNRERVVERDETRRQVASARSSRAQTCNIRPPLPKSALHPTRG